MLDDRTVVGQSRFFGGVVDTQPKGFAINFDLCSKLLPFPVHTSVPSGVSRIQSSFRVTHRVFRSSLFFLRGGLEAQESRSPDHDCTTHTIAQLTTVLQVLCTTSAQ